MSAPRKNVPAEPGKMTWKDRFQNMNEASAAAEGDINSSRAVLTDHLALDCEMVGVGIEGKRSALARVCLVNVDGVTVYDKHCAVPEPITDFRTHVSGIRAKDLRTAEPFKVVQREVSEMIRTRTVVGHSLKNDFKALMLDQPRSKLRDTAQYKPLRPMNKSVALKKLALEHLEVEIQEGEHSPAEDARASLCLYLKHQKEWEQFVKVTAKSSKGR